MRDRIEWAFALVVGIAAALPTGAFADAKVEEQVVAPAGRDVTYLVSPSGVHLAAVANKGSRIVVLIDGVEGPKVDKMLTRDGRRVVIRPRPPSGPSAI